VVAVEIYVPVHRVSVRRRLFVISSPAILVPSELRRFPFASAWSGQACPSVRVVGVALYIAHPINLEIFEMSVVGVAVPGLDTVWSGLLDEIGSNSDHV